MAIPASDFQPAIDALEQDLANLERQANVLLTGINLLREKAGLPPRSGGFGLAIESGSGGGATVPIKLNSDTFTGKKLASAACEYLEMRKASGGDPPATTREIFDALKEGGFSSGAKDDKTGMIVLGTMLRKNSGQFHKLANGKYGLRAWYGNNLKTPKQSAAGTDQDDGDDDGDVETETDDKANAQSSAA